MQHKDLFLDRAKGPATTPPKRGGEPEHVSTTFPEVIRQLAKRHEISEEEVIERLRGKVIPPNEA